MTPAQQKQIEQYITAALGVAAIVATVWVWNWIDDVGDRAKAGLEDAHQSIVEFEADMDRTCAGSTSAFCQGWRSGR